MKKAPDFASDFADIFKEYVEFMINLGRNFRVETTILRAFDRYLIQQNIDEITETAAVEFTYSVINLSKAQYDKRHRIIRKFSEYLALRHETPTVRPLPQKDIPKRHIAYVYTDDELGLILDEAKKLNPVPKLRPHTFYTLLGLLASTGMRISEAINLDVNDIDFKNGIIKIKNTKFRKSRLIPVHKTTLAVLKKYDKLRRELITNPKDNAFFLNKYKLRLKYANVNDVFLQIIRKLNIRSKSGNGARIHDIRHVFAIRRIASWYDMGLDIHQMLPLLSTYMGHAHFEDTVYYLNAGAELLAKGAERFNKGGDMNG